MTVFLDTMLYLHYRRLEEIDLPRILGASSILIVIPRITVRELDTHKSRHSSGKVRDRARRILQLAEASAVAPLEVCPGVQARYYAATPSESYSDLGLNPQWNDDQLIATILEYKKDHPNEDVLLISQDTGPRLTASLHGIAVQQVPEEYRLPLEPDAIESENKELKKVIERLQRALPQLAVSFGGSDPPQSHATYSLHKPSELRPEEVTARVDEIRSQHPKLNPPRADDGEDTPQARLIRALALSSDFYQVPAEEYGRYNNEIEQYYAHYGQFLHELYEYQARNKRTISFTIQVANTGTEPADDVDISIFFPNGFTLCREDDLPHPPEKPALPRPPQSKMQQLVQNMNSSLIPYFDLPVAPHFNTHTSFSLRRTNSYEVSDHFERIKHGFMVTLPKLYLTFETYETASSFGCRYVLSPGNLPSPIEGELHFVINKEAAP